MLRVATPLVSCFIALNLLGASPSDIPANIDTGLRQVISQTRQTTPAAATAAPVAAAKSGLRIGVRPMRDMQNRVLVNIRLNGKETVPAVHAQLVSTGASIVAENESYKNGIVSAFVPVERMADVARLSAVRSLSLAHRPLRNIGAATSGGVYVLHTDLLNAQGVNGSGITLGVLSDSYDTATMTESGDPLSIHAAQDVASGDLPGPGNPNGHTDPVNVFQDFAPGPGDDPTFDEGRAMLQIVHDVAPNADLAFATALPTTVAFANNIRSLRTAANCDVIVDDVIYTEEPFFSDGIVAQAVNDVAFSSSLSGHKVIYFSAAGNQQGGGYVANFTPVTDASARAGLPNQNIQLNQVDPSLTSGGFHNFNSDPTGPVDISQSFPIPAGTSVEVDLQWNDPFDQNGVTTNYNLLIFDADGNFLAQFSGTDDNFSTQEPIEDVTVENAGSSDTTFQIVISRAGTSPATPVAQKLRYLAIDNFGNGVSPNEYYVEGAPCTFGHSCAAGALGVAAYVYDDNPSDPPGPPFTPFIEDFTSPGPSTIDFDAAGNRLAQSEVRQKPDVAAPDGGNTTFFGFDYEGDGLPNFFGTSAAAPHAAGVAALLLQKAGGSDSLTLTQVRSALRNSVLSAHDIDPFFSSATAAAAGGKKKKMKGSKATVLVTGLGDSSNGSAHDPNFFTVTFNPGKKGESLREITINLVGAGLKFDTTQATGSAFTFGRLTGISSQNIVAFAPAGNDSFETVTLEFVPGSFTGSTSVSFGIDRDFIGDGGGNSADLLPGATISATTNKGVILGGTFNNTFGSGYSLADGFGLIDGQKAAQQVH